MTTSPIEQAGQFIDQYDHEGNVMVKLCCDLTLYVDGNPLDNRAGLLRLYQRALDLIGPWVTFISNGKAQRYKPAPKNLSGLLQRWLDGGGPARGSYGLCLESGATYEDVSDRAFSLVWVLGRCYLRVMLPASECAAKPDVTAKTFMDLTEGIRFSSGHAGFATNVYSGYYGASPNGAIALVAQRYLGVDLEDPLYWSRHARTSIKTVNWLTFLGPQLLARVAEPAGGVAAFAASLGDGVTFTPLPHGAVLQAGPAPRLGDVQAGETLPEYRRVAAALRALRIPDETLRRYDGIGGSENTRRWLDRFL